MNDILRFAALFSTTKIRSKILNFPPIPNYSMLPIVATKLDKHTLEDLRKAHPVFTYRAFTISDDQKGSCTISYSFSLSPSITFTPTITIPVPAQYDPETLRMFAFHLGMVELISYWKCSCSPTIRIEAGHLEPEAISFWADLLRYGLGEFYFVNQIDFTAPDFVRIEVAPNAPRFIGNTFSGNKGDLVLVGGGKDSCVTLELFRSAQLSFRSLIVNPIRASLESASIVGDADPLVVKRTIDPKLIELNRAGYLNGHTPFSAMLAFLGVMLASLYGYENVIASNEGSANEENIEYRGLSINHQYSKSYRFEVLFGKYGEQFLTSHTKYFSFLRPLYELQISRLFSKYPQHFTSFRSCNVHQKQDSWCGRCPKCCFVYLCLRPFISSEQVTQIFGNELFDLPENGQIFLDLAGFGEYKPLECVGTHRETVEAVAMCSGGNFWKGRTVPSIVSDIVQRAVNTHESAAVIHSWSTEHALPERYEIILREALEK